IDYLYYGSGHLHQISLDGEVVTDIERDKLHREIQRTQGGVSSLCGYDFIGRLGGRCVVWGGVLTFCGGRGSLAGGVVGCCCVCGGVCGLVWGVGWGGCVFGCVCGGVGRV
ncbi:hypothetical protein ACTHUM_19310, partial [Neisseria sp. P0021.S006]